MRLNHLQRVQYYGQPCSGHRPVATVWGLRVPFLEPVWAEFVRACQEAASRGCRPPLRIDSYSCRRIAGTSSWSLHSWPLAFDAFMTPPGVAPPGGVWTPDDALDPVLVSTFERRGWTWGGRWGRRDTPHFEWAGPPPPR